MRHVPDGIDVDQRADAGDEQHEHQRQRVDQQAGVDLEAADRDPGVQMAGRPRGCLPLDREEQDDRVDEQHDRHERAEQVPHLSPRLPTSSSTAADTSGRATSSQAALWMPCAVVTVGPSVLQEVGVVHRRRPPGSEDGHDDRETHDDLGGGDHHDEERHDLAVQGAVDARERDQGEVDRVEHQLDAHEHHDRVLAHEHADRADREQCGAETR